MKEKINLTIEQTQYQIDKIVDFLSDKNITKIVTLARGGYIISRLISQKLNIRKIYSIGIEFYDNENNANEPILYQTLTQKFNTNDIIVIIDDIADSGKSLEIAKNEVIRNGGNRIITCTLHYKPHSKYKPDYYAQEIDNNIWINYYWE